MHEEDKFEQQHSTPKRSGILPFVLVLGGFILITIIIKVVMELVN